MGIDLDSESNVKFACAEVASSPGLLRGSGKEGQVLTVCACAAFSIYFTIKVYRQYPDVIGKLILIFATWNHCDSLSYYHYTL